MSWNFDPQHSHIEFAVRHMVIHTVRGWFDRFNVNINYDEQNPTNTTVEATIEAASLNTRSEQRDAHLRSADFLDAEKYPTLTFKSKRVEQSGKNRGRLIGDLTIRGVTREVALDLTNNGQIVSPWGTTVAGFVGETKISRKEWGLTWNQILEGGSLLVGDEITITIELELHKQPEAAPAEAEELVAVPA
jgi:polyisoprenoid-binding protein YceI